jgi:hypothetical protein
MPATVPNWPVLANPNNVKFTPAKNEVEGRKREGMLNSMTDKLGIKSVVYLKIEKSHVLHQMTFQNDDDVHNFRWTIIIFNYTCIRLNII